MRKNKDGTTMVSVIVAFAILLLSFTVFYQATQLAMKFVNKAESVRMDTENTMEQYYLKDGSFDGANADLSLVEQNGGTALSMSGSLGVFTPDVGTKKVYYYGKEKTVASGSGVDEAVRIINEKYPTGLGNDNTKKVNEALSEESGYPMVSDAEKVSANAILANSNPGVTVTLPDNLFWKANVWSTGNYYLYATLDTSVSSGYTAYMLYLETESEGGHIYVVTHAENGSIVPINKQLNAGPADIIAAITTKNNKLSDVFDAKLVNMDS